MPKSKQHPISLADFISLLGLGLIGYGLYQFIPWVSFVVVGSLLLVGGVRLGRVEVVTE